MEHILQIIVFLTLIKYCTKAGLFEHRMGMVAYALFVGVVAVVLFPYVLKTNSDIFQQLLSRKNDISNIAVLITIEAISGMLISIGMLGDLFSGKKRRQQKIVMLTPGVMIVGAVFFLELELMRYLAGADFVMVRIVCAAALIVGVYLFSWILRKVLRDREIRFELKFLTNLLLLFLAIVLNAGIADYNQSNYQAKPELTKMLVFMAIVAGGFIIGYILFIKRKIFKKRRLK
ncbi:hypothetical protein EYV94_23615 [Puteibacter caeruleilacunae]|nr:hypothetical protein EYV94_23615 [Puteibacter caeruleilacunae]